MLGGRDYSKLISDKLKQIHSMNLKSKYVDNHTIDAEEAIQCTRLSYYERRERLDDSVPEIVKSFLKETFRSKLDGATAEFKVEKLTLVVDPAFIVEDVIVNFSVVSNLPDEVTPPDLLYTNACLFALDKDLGVVVYVTPNGEYTQFFVGKSNRMFEHVIRRARILSMLLEEQKTPAIEPSYSCLSCKYYGRCFPQQRDTNQNLLEGLFGSRK
jgi:CRISPR-associated exonuclease Cas4